MTTEKNIPKDVREAGIRKICRSINPLPQNVDHDFAGQ